MSLRVRVYLLDSYDAGQASSMWPWSAREDAKSRIELRRLTLLHSASGKAAKEGTLMRQLISQQSNNDRQKRTMDANEGTGSRCDGLPDAESECFSEKCRSDISVCAETSKEKWDCTTLRHLASRRLTEELGHSRTNFLIYLAREIALSSSATSDQLTCLRSPDLKIEASFERLRNNQVSQVLIKRHAIETKEFERFKKCIVEQLWQEGLIDDTAASLFNTKLESTMKAEVFSDQSKNAPTFSRNGEVLKSDPGEAMDFKSHNLNTTNLENPSFPNPSFSNPSFSNPSFSNPSFSNPSFPSQRQMFELALPNLPFRTCPESEDEVDASLSIYLSTSPKSQRKVVPETLDTLSQAVMNIESRPNQGYSAQWLSRLDPRALQRYAHELAAGLLGSVEEAFSTTESFADW